MFDMISYNKLVAFITLTSAGVIIVGVVRPVIWLSENQILYLYSAAAQVVAAIFGLTIAGYVFLRNELDRKSDEDESYDEIVRALKSDYHVSIVGISIIVIISILLSLFVVAIENIRSQFLVTIILNFSSMTVFSSLLLVATFIIEILDPMAIEKISGKIRKEIVLSVDQNVGKLEDFLKAFNEIEGILEKYGRDAYFKSDKSYEKSETLGRRKYISNSRMARILLNSNIISNDLADKINKLSSFRNTLIHGNDLSVTRGDVEVAERVLLELKIALNVNQN